MRSRRRNRRTRKSRRRNLRMSAACSLEQFEVVDDANDGMKMRICGESESESERSDEASWSESRGWPQTEVGRSDATS
jgi:hypothetical protein